MFESTPKPNRMMKLSLPLIVLLLGINPCAMAEDIHYYCDGDTTRTLGDGPHVEETDSKTYAIIGNETEFYTDKIKCDIDPRTIQCSSKKFNRTLKIDKLTGYTVDTYEIFKHGKPHVKIEFIGMCERYQISK
ncbi:exported protein of unknown function [Candidatus Methylopumilus turicensis]|jgi:hypothetical protein|uniref:Lipoprotein n=2 Tax=Candidatus Methylopumilus turicensis TaxID=1581680 RepID=A0A0B7J0K1_9PROT|nr:exported protein of unknown function [Candidatus Methylopumilus turicensis]